MILKPLGNKIVVEPLKAEDQVINGILMTAASLGEAVLKGTVVAAGPQASVKPGDVVAFGRYGFDEMKDGARKLYVMPEELVLTVVVEETVATA